MEGKEGSWAGAGYCKKRKGLAARQRQSPSYWLEMLVQARDMTITGIYLPTVPR
jgi:hypothetical protein